jgi:NAD(P)-dependent dehydrogenase (short-subunit alcohol dehydrogenase family)
MTSLPLDGKIAWVTGGASGIGFAIVQKLETLGARVAILDIARPEGLDPSIEIHDCDIASSAAVDAVATALEQDFGPADILVNSAGTPGSAPLAEFPDALWNRIVAINLTGSFNVVRRVIGGMIERRWGRIILLGSDAAFLPGPGQAAYASTKAAVAALGRIAAIEGGPAGVTCNVLSPGIIDTPMTRQRWSTREAMETAIANSFVRNPMGVVLDADDLANAAGFLCLPASGHITGQTLSVNGGMIMR